VVKVLDFGLAKLAQPGSRGTHGDVTASPHDHVASPHDRRRHRAWHRRVHVRRAAKGHEADKRSDIWAFGCVLYEILTGRRAFDGDDMTEVPRRGGPLEPDWLVLPANVPPPLRHGLRPMSRQGSPQRIGDIAAARFVLDHQADGAATSTAAARACRAERVGGALAALTIGAVALAAVAADAHVFVIASAAPRVVRTTIAAPVGGVVLSSTDRDIAITPDGSRIGYHGGDNQLLVRP